MASDDPFSEQDDSERTVIRPNPGGRRNLQQPPAQQPQPGAQPSGVPAAAPQAPGAGQPPRQGGDEFGYGVPTGGAPQRPASPPSGGEDEAALTLSFTGLNRLVASASPLFALVSRIRNRAQHADPERLRQSVVGEVREFESRALQAGCEAKDVKVARYAICATLDDVVLNTPWGETSAWQSQSMVATFHREVVGGDRFYDLLARLEQDPANNLEMLEFLYMCLSLGFEGRLRVEQGGQERHREVREGLARLIRAQRGPVERGISPHWEGLEVPNRTLSIWRPVWIALGTAVALLTAGFLGLSWALGGATDNLTGRLSALEPDIAPTIDIKAPPPPPPPAPPLSDKFREFLKPEIDEGLVEIEANANVMTIRLKGSALFASGSNVLQEQYRQPVLRVAKALNDEPGPVIIAGHSDNVPIRSSRYASNMELSLARAETVRKLMAPSLEDPTRLSAEGRADKEPLASNDSREGRARNRRIEILLVRVEE